MRTRLGTFCAVSALAVWTAGESRSASDESSESRILFSGDVDADHRTIDEVIANGPFGADWAALAENPVADWYVDAKFGIFIHWGPYAVPAIGNEWYPRRMYLDELDRRQNLNYFEHHRKTWGPHKTFGYKDFIPMFKAEAYAPEPWADLFQEAGARYVVPVGEHHDGKVVDGVRLLSHDGTLEWSQGEEALAIKVPQGDTGAHAFVFELSLE